DTDPANGCDTDLNGTTAHCGACNNDCGALPNVAMANCGSGMCSIDMCAAGFEDCDGDPMNGCEAAGCRIETDLIAYYTFTEGTGKTLNDTSGFGTPLTLTWPGNGVSWISGRNGISINS